MIDANEINKLLAEGFLKSEVGKRIEESVKKAVGGFGYDWDRTIKMIVDSYMQEQVRLILTTTHAQAIKDLVAKKCAELVTDEVVGQMVTKALKVY